MSRDKSYVVSRVLYSRVIGNTSRLASSENGLVRANELFAVSDFFALIDLSIYFIYSLPINK